MMLAMIAVGALVGLTVLEAGLPRWLFGDTRWLALCTGAVIGLLWALLLRLQRRVEALEKQLTPAAAAQAPATASTRADSNEAPGPQPIIEQGPAEPEPPPGRSMSTPPAPQASPPVDTAPRAAWPWPQLSAWFARGNVPVKIGMLVLLVGLAALLRYAGEQGWLAFSIEARLLLVSGIALVGLLIGWRLRTSQPVFALALQGGAIGALLLTVFAAYQLYHILPEPLALSLAAGLIAGAGLLAVLQNALTLAVLAMLAGFAAPLLLPTTWTQPTALFAWYALLNLAVCAVAWRCRWPLLNRLGLLFSFAVGSLWGYLAWDAAYQPVAQCYLVLYFLLYWTIPLLQVRLREPERIDAVVVFGLPLLALPLQAALVEADAARMALATLIGALLYLGSASLLLARWQRRVLVEAHAILALGLATLAVPLAFSGPSISLIWVLQGAALVWFGCRAQRRWPRLTGLALQALAAMVWLMQGLFGRGLGDTLALNPSGMAGLALSLAALISAWRYARAGAAGWRVNLLAGSAVFFWLVNGIQQLEHHLALPQSVAGVIGFLAITLGLLTQLARRSAWTIWPAAQLLLLLLAAVWSLHPASLATAFAALDSSAWLLMVAAIWSLDRLRSATSMAWRAALLAAGHVAGGLWLSLNLARHAELTLGLGGGWIWLAGAMPLLIVTVLLISGRRPPLAAGRIQADERRLLSSLALLLLGIGLALSLADRGNSNPLPWLPLLNPLELAQLAALLLLIAAAWRPPAGLRVAPAIPLALALASLSVMALRAVHQLADIAWTAEALLGSALGQAALSLLWTLIGVIAWVLGSRRGLPALWWTGAVLLGMVLLKLGLIDRQYLSQVAGIVSFLGFGLLAVLIGYLAPAPPRAATLRESGS